jgi:hypothetical protein
MRESECDYFSNLIACHTPSGERFGEGESLPRTPKRQGSSPAFMAGSALWIGSLEAPPATEAQVVHRLPGRAKPSSKSSQSKMQPTFATTERDWDFALTN